MMTVQLKGIASATAYSICKLVATGLGIMLMLSLPQIVYAVNAKAVQPATKSAKQNVPVKQGKPPIAVTVHGNVRGFEWATQRTDGAMVVRDRISGKGSVEAEHVIIEGELSPGNSPGCIDFSGNLTFSSTAALVIELAGTVPCTEHDQINVANTLTINNAAFELVLINAFMPQFGDSFNVLNWGVLSGSGFSSIDTSVATLTYPLEWDFTELYVTGKITVGVINIADGDLAPWDNPDGNINAADLMIVTQLVLDQRVPGALQYAHGDMNSDGVIDVADLILIQQLVMQN